jgi:RNA polymerase sigma-70 factor (ECF subfamily)
MNSDRPPLDDLTFGGVMVAVKAGDQRATELLFADMHPRVLRFLRAAEPRFADDIAGEVWLAVARGLVAFEGDLAGFRGWVFTIARRRLADHRRTAVRRATEPVERGFFLEREADADTEGDAVDGMSAQDALDTINRLLSADQAEVLTLRIVGELDVAHVAQVMGRSANWVRVTQHRALRRLAATATSDGDGSERFRHRVIPMGSWTI